MTIIVGELDVIRATEVMFRRSLMPHKRLKYTAFVAGVLQDVKSRRAVIEGLASRRDSGWRQRAAIRKRLIASSIPGFPA